MSRFCPLHSSSSVWHAAIDGEAVQWSATVESPCMLLMHVGSLRRRPRNSSAAACFNRWGRCSTRSVRHLCSSARRPASVLGAVHAAPRVVTAAREISPHDDGSTPSPACMHTLKLYVWHAPISLLPLDLITLSRLSGFHVRSRVASSYVKSAHGYLT